MRYVDTFTQPSEAWVRGHAVLGRKNGRVNLDPLPNAGHATLSGMVVNPLNLRDFEATIGWKSTSVRPVGLTIAVCKPHEWSSIDESAARIDIALDGCITLHNAAGHTVTAQAGVDQQDKRRWINIARNEDTLTVTAGDQSCSISINAADGGYLAIHATNTGVKLRHFEIRSPHNFPPLTHWQRQDDIRSWLRWRCEQNHRDLLEIKSAVRDSGWGYDTDIQVAPGMVRCGEPVIITLSARGSQPPSGSINVQSNYLSEEAPQPHSIDVEWIPSGENSWTAQAEIVPSQPGNWQITWDTGDEILSRVFTVVDEGYAVCTLWVGSNRPDIDTELHKYSLPGDYWVGDWWSPFGQPAGDVLDYVRPYAKMRHLYGDRLVPFINAGYIIPEISALNLQDLDAEFQEDGIALVQQLWDTLGIGPLEIIGSYTLGHATPRIAKRLGIKSINSLCTWQNWVDGYGNLESGWKMNHWGAPNVPYYVADDDFRKAAPGKSIVASSMGTATSVRNYCIFTMEGCPSLTNPMQRYTDNIAPSVNMTRFYDAVDGWINDTKYQDELVFFSIGLENFGARPDWQKANALAIDYLVEQAKTTKLVFASTADITDYFQAHYSEQPETIFYQPDIYCGYRCQNKPAQLPDRIEISNCRMHTLHTAGQVLPQFFWDYTKPWNEPEWDNMFPLRDEHGLITPERLRADTTVPRQVNLDHVQADVSMVRTSDGVEISVDISTDKPLKLLPVAVWKIPLSSADACIEDIDPYTRWIRVIDWTTGNLHGVIVCEDVPAGKSVRTIKLRGSKREPLTADFTMGKVCGRTIYRDGTPHTYLWRDAGVAPGTLHLQLPLGQYVEVRYNDGQVQTPDQHGKLVINFDKTWQHETPMLVGLSGLDLTTTEQLWESL